MKKYIIFIIISLFGFSNILIAQVKEPCDVGAAGFSPVQPLNVHQSSTLGGANPQLAIDGVNSGSLLSGNATQTQEEKEPYWEANLGDKYTLEGIRVWFESGYYDTGFKNYYVLLSEFPFQGDDLTTELSSPTVKYYYIQSELPNGYQIPLEGNHAQYVRIQLAEQGSLSLLEVEIPGDGTDEEICGNGIDDDCDGLIDCHDPDCSPVIGNVEKVNPSCSACNDGQLIIQAWGGGVPTNELFYSIDGNEFHPFNPLSTNSSLCLFDNLPEGEYNIVVTTAKRECFPSYGPVVLEAITGVAHEHCPNGGFEEGNFNLWTGGLALNPEMNPGMITFGNETINMPEQHDIIMSSNDLDPYGLDDIPLTSPTGNLFFSKLGVLEATNSNEAWKAQRLTYCFDVDSDNADFGFFYALVLEDGNSLQPHTSSQNPFFQWRFYNDNTLLNLEDIGDNPRRIIANVDDPFFTTKEIQYIDLLGNEQTSAVTYRGWTCVDKDLTQFIGQRVCVEFITSTCSIGGHGGYAYIDALCASNQAPHVEMDVNEIYCKGQDISIDADGSLGYNQYQWEICEYLNGNASNCKSTNLEIGSDVPVFENILDWYFDQSGTGSRDCDDNFRLKLTLHNDCQLSEETRDFQYKCNESSLDYSDIVNCFPGFNEDIPIQGNNNCNGCTDFQWTPSDYLDNPNIEFPTILTSQFVLPPEVNYSVVATNEDGCQIEGNVNVIFASIGNISLSTTTVSGDDCNFTPMAELEMDIPIDPSKLKVEFTISGQEGMENSTNEFEETYEAVLVGSSNDQSFIYSISSLIVNPHTLSRCHERTISVSVTVRDSGNAVIIGTCTMSDELVRPKDGLFCGSPYIPNAFSPNGDGLNDYFRMYFPTDGGAQWATMRIYDRWGNEVFDGTAIAPVGGPALTGNEPMIRWDGTGTNGQFYNNAVFVYVIDFYNCDFGSSGCGDTDCSVGDIVSGDCDTCPASYSGDVTITL